MRASEGEPVCDGPLILAVNDSSPPQCDAPSAALPTVGLILYAIGFFPSMLLTAVLQARDSRKAIGTYSLGDPLLNVQATGALVRVIARASYGLPTGTSDHIHVSEGSRRGR